MKNKNVAILGAGKTGLSAYNHYKKLGYNVFIWDENTEIVNFLKNSYNFVSFFDWDYSNLHFIITSPGIALEHPKKHFVLEKAQKNKIKIYCDIELFIEENPNIKYIAVSGTNGKSTTVALIQNIFSTAQKKCTFAGNIGIPIFDINPENYEYIVLELSSYQLDLMNKIHFNCALLLNIQEDHIEHHGSFENYKNVKYKIFQNQTQNDIAILDEEIYQNIKDKLKSSKIVPVSTKNSNTNAILVTKNNIVDNYFNQNKSIINYSELTYLKGDHNYLNIAFAYAAAKFFNLSDNEIINGIKSFKGLKHRQNNVKVLNNITFINDSKATNQQSTLQALKAFNNVYLILGGLAKSDNLDVILPYLKDVKGIFLIGSSTSLFAKILQNNSISFVVCKDLKEATNSAYNLALKEKIGTVLLSPACASFDQFKSFEDRGDTFIKIVESLN